MHLHHREFLVFEAFYPFPLSVRWVKHMGRENLNLVVSSNKHVYLVILPAVKKTIFKMHFNFCLLL